MEIITSSPLNIFRCERCSHCALCGSTEGVQLHHLGGQNHAPFFVIPLCTPHHKRVTIAIQQMGRQMGNIDLMKYTPDPLERARRARLAALVFLWFIDEVLDEQKQNANALGEQNASRSNRADGGKAVASLLLKPITRKRA